VAMVQGLFIMLGSALVFGVDWGDPAAAAAILIIFSLGAAATGMLMGAIFKNDQQAGGLGVVIGLGLAALGGCMLPLSIMKVFSPGLWKVAHITPHAWGVEAYEEIILRDGGMTDIALDLGVLAAFALVMFVLATWRLRVTLTKA
jgi:ABC-2 type transport system permease protein